MTVPHPRRGFDWDTAGRELGDSLDGYHAIVVVGVDPVATGRVAVAAARVQAVKRRVAVGDLFAESPPIQELVESEDPHGLVDSFQYGVSLSRIAHLVAGAGELYVMPSGTEPPYYEEIFPNPRWHRLTAGFREVGALLILAAPASAPHIEDLVAATDGAVLVGEGVPRTLPVATVITSVREPRAVEAQQTAPPPAAPTPATSRWPRRRLAAIGGVVLTLVLAGVAAWLAYRPLAGERAHVGGPPDTTKGLHAVIPAVGPDTAVRPSAADSEGPVVTVPTIVNPRDSANAAIFAVELANENTQAGAILKLQRDGKNLPAATFAPVLIQGSRWFKIIGGAYPTAADANLLLANLRRQKILDPDKGRVVRLPLAFRIDSGVPAAAVPALLATYAEHGIPVYGLQQEDGTAWLLAGAFESVDQSVLYAESLRSSGRTPVLVYRKGRVF